MPLALRALLPLSLPAVCLRQMRWGSRGSSLTRCAWLLRWDLLLFAFGKCAGSTAVPLALRALLHQSHPLFASQM
ncbi:hypothetical protein TCA2_4197 [Paenibacillus sp. TCA20]|nr:hypothetical protein TCA2_4197 [Paenibacillus sp. TCA20]